MILLSLFFGLLFGSVKRYNEIKQYNEINQAAFQAEAEARQRKYYMLQDELNNIEFQLNLLCRLEEAQRIDTTKTRNEYDIKTALATQTKIHSLVKRKNKILSDLENL